ncbi:hypothetical protein, partial [Burkholderia pseudomallei]|uniref:hypothetical protein n=1 Tax=Burkholderia pseudomallei TaxID=28450 RepID=UPI0021F6DE51
MRMMKPCSMASDRYRGETAAMRVGAKESGKRGERCVAGVTREVRDAEVHRRDKPGCETVGPETPGRLGVTEDARDVHH